jgi:NifB/MoaA-like Fe-S oxidoreductase
MFEPMLAALVQRYNEAAGTRLSVLAAPNTYFGGDVAVAGLLTGQDIVGIKERVEGDQLIVPKHVIKSDEPVLLDGMTFDGLQAAFEVPLVPIDSETFFRALATRL